MTHVLIMLALGASLFFLVHRGIIQIDLSFPWFVAIVFLGLLSSNEAFVLFFSRTLGIIYPPIAIIFATVFVLFGLITIILAIVTILRRRQISIVRSLATLELTLQERAGDEHS